MPAPHEECPQLSQGEGALRDLRREVHQRPGAQGGAQTHVDHQTQLNLFDILFV